MAASELLADAARIRRLRARLLSWYDLHKRQLPWRDVADPYQVWISEIMLQQTRVEQMRGYFERFVAAFPTVEALAGAPEEAVLKAWEGLGYYARARNLQAAARKLVAEFDGQLPQTREQLLELPGIGPYTAGRGQQHRLRPRPPGSRRQRHPRPLQVAARRGGSTQGRGEDAPDRRGGAPAGPGQGRRFQPGPDGARGPRLHAVAAPLRRTALWRGFAPPAGSSTIRRACRSRRAGRSALTTRWLPA